MGGISILTSKELSATYQPLLLCEFEFSNGTFFRVSTHPLSSGYGGTPTAGSYEYGGHSWAPRVLNQDLGATQSMADFGFDVPPTVTVVMADSDGEVYSLEMANGFKGAVLKLYSVMWDTGDAATGSFNSDNPTFVKFIGTCGPATAIDQKTTSVTAVSLLNMTQQQMPPVRIQPLCPWSFPPTATARANALANSDSQYYECGYSPDLVGGVGNYASGTACFTFCDQSQAACIARLGNSTAAIPILRDKLGRATGRFGGFDFVPVQNVGLTRPYVSGQWTLTIDAVNQARYGDYIPMAYGTTWIEPEIMGVYGDGNYTRFEALACFNQCSEVLNVVVNGVVIPWYAGSNSDGVSAPGRTNSVKDNYWMVINSGDRNGGSNPLIGWANKGDCYGSTFGIAVQCLAALASQSTLPQCQMLLKAGQVRVYTDVSTYTLEYSDNPAWILLDLLVKTSWRYSQINIQSFIDAAAVCDAQIYFNSLKGTYTNAYYESVYNPYTRYSVGFSVKQRMPIGDLIRGVRNSMRGMLYFDFNTGLLTVGNKQTLADQQSSPVAGSNYNLPVASVRCMTTELANPGGSMDATTTIAYALVPAQTLTPPGTVIMIDSEKMTVSSSSLFNPGAGPIGAIETLVVVRGVGGTTALSHSSGATIFFPGDGYVAYSFNGASIMKDDKGASTLKISQRQSQETPNKVTNYFFDRENQYGQDISTLIDVEDVDRIGAEVTGSFSLIGPQTFDHINRVTATWFAENYRGNPRRDYQGSEIGDTGGTLRFEFETSVKAIHLTVGQICLISDAQRGIVNQLFRISSIQPSQNFETAKITGYWHNDAWYADDFGQGANQGVYANPRSAGQGIPRPWHPGYEAPQAGNVYHGNTDLGFGLAQFYGTAADNTVIAQIQVSGQVPVNSFPDIPLSPQLEVVGAGDTGGGYPSGTAYFVGLSAMTPGGLGMSPLSNVCPVSLSPSQNALDVVAQGWPEAGSGYFAFVGSSPSSMTCQVSSAVETSLIQLKNSYHESAWGPPDQNFSNFVINVSVESHAGVFGAEVLSVTSDSITFYTYGEYGFTINQFAGCEVSVLGVQGDSSSPVFVPIADFGIASNTRDTLVLSAGDPTTCVYGSSLRQGDAVVLRIKPVFGKDSIGNYFEDSNFVNMFNPVGISYSVNGASNTFPIVVSVVNDGTGGDFLFGVGQFVIVEGVAGNLAANGGFYVSAVDSIAWTVTLALTTGNGDYVETGTATIVRQYLGLVTDSEKGNTAFAYAGTGKGMSVQVASNTSTRVYVVGDWPVVPDSTTRLIILKSAISSATPSLPISNSIPQFLGTYDANVINYGRQTLFVRVSVKSAGGLLSASMLDPFREIFLYGSAGALANADGFYASDSKTSNPEAVGSKAYTAANALPGTTGLMYFNGARWRQSVASRAGVRVWNNLASMTSTTFLIINPTIISPPYTGMDDQMWAATVVQDATGHVVGWDPAFKMVDNTTVPMTPGLTSQLTFVGRSSDSAWILTGSVIGRNI